jgi:hypothetical protein
MKADGNTLVRNLFYLTVLSTQAELPAQVTEVT